MQDIQDRTGTIPAKTNEGRLEERMLSMDSLLHASLDRAMLESEFDDIAGRGYMVELKFGWRSGCS